VAKTITATYARKNFGQLLNEVSLLEETFFIQRAGRTMAALVSVEHAERLPIELELVKTVERLLKKIKGPRSKKLEKAIAEVESLLSMGRE
jgi:hypothetical protein